jgi:ATP-binding cassette subfamily B protein
VRNATRILVFDQGRIIESGSFDELVARNGRFAALARAQFMVGAAPAPAALLVPADADVEAPEDLAPSKASG